ncbi:hypothetical protein A2U01_0085879, partial [Trifolium medium]|nr:hypothetical protein [Trifolium medium]
SPSCSAAHRESQPSLAHNLNTSATEGCEVEPDAADAADNVEQEAVAMVLLLPVLSLNLSLPS